MINNKIKDILLNNNGVSIINIDGSYLRKDKHGKLYYNTNEDIKFKNKDGIEICKVNIDGNVYDNDEILSIHKMSAKHLNKTNNNGWYYFYIKEKQPVS